MFPKITIVTVSYNHAEYIEDNIKSVIAQNYNNLEHIIIDANSTDGTLAILNKYQNHITWISEPDNGQSHGLNKGFKKATGDIIGWVNSDDQLASGALHKISNFFQENPDEIAVVGDQLIISAKGETLRKIQSRSYNHNYLLNQARGITQNSTFFKRHVFDKIGYIDESLSYAMDLDFFIRITKIKKILYLPETLAIYRMHPYSKTAEGPYKFAIESLKIRKKNNGSIFSPANINALYIIIFQPLRQIKWFRLLIQKLRQI
ncbi:MAG: glycosyltransferase [Flavobacteriaceae bacterium]|nr:glycosyltransferase [Flavobacteriaceae bacterium]